MRLITVLNKKQTRKQANRQYVVKVWYTTLVFSCQVCVLSFDIVSEISPSCGRVLRTGKYWPWEQEKRSNETHDHLLNNPESTAWYLEKYRHKNKYLQLNNVMKNNREISEKNEHELLPTNKQGLQLYRTTDLFQDSFRSCLRRFLKSFKIVAIFHPRHYTVDSL